MVSLFGAAPLFGKAQCFICAALQKFVSERDEQEAETSKRQVWRCGVIGSKTCGGVVSLWHHRTRKEVTLAAK